MNSWRVRRKRTIISIIILIILAFSIYKLYPYIFPKPTCFDHIQNGLEDGVDCGGGCQLICETAILPVEIKSVRAIETEKDLYDLVAIVQNKNNDKEPNDGLMTYRFSIYDKAGTLIKSIDINSELMLGQSFPVIIQNIPLTLADSGNSVSKVAVSVLPDNKDWLKVSEVYTQNFFKVDSVDFKQDYNNISQLRVTLDNLTKANFKNIPIRVILKDKLGNIIAVNETILPSITPDGQADVVYTWRLPLSDNNPDVSVYPIITPFSQFN